MKILIVEDDRKAAESLAKGLNENGFQTDIENDGLSGLKKAETGDYDALIVDRMLPGLDGLSLTKEMRSQGRQTPVLILTALTEVDDTVEGLEAGGDDYMSKPYAFAELLARIRVLIRRQQAPAANEVLLKTGDIEIDRIARTVYRAQQAILLQPKEFDLLLFLAENEDQIVTRKMLLKNVWGLDFDPNTNVVNVHVSRLRQKIDKGFRNPLITTRRGMGYVFSTKTDF